MGKVTGKIQVPIGYVAIVCAMFGAYTGPSADSLGGGPRYVRSMEPCGVIRYVVIHMEIRSRRAERM